MSKEYFLSVRAAPPLIDDEYTEDMQPLPYRQPPRLTRTQAEAAWREERETAFFSILMVHSTSYRSDWIDDLMSPDSGRRRFEAWQRQIERDREQRNRSYERMMQEVERDKRKSAGVLSPKPAERRTPTNDD